MTEAIDIRTYVKRAIMLAMIVAFVCLLPDVAYAVKPGPHLDSLSASAAAPGTSVTLRGTDFGAAQPATSFVTFNGVRADVVSWSDTEIVAKVPTRCVAGYVGITVDNITSNGLWFAPTGRPNVVALSSYLAPPGSTITVLGTGFGATQRTGRVTFPGADGPVTAPIVFWSDSRIVCVVPDVPDVGYMGVWQNGAPSNGKLFMPFLPPAITELSSQKASPGSTLTITGRRFGPKAKGRVKIGNQEIEPLSWTDTSVTITIPDDAPSGYVGVIHSGSCSNGVYLYVVPKIESVSSWWVEPGSQLTIDGSGFTAATRVTIAGQEMPIVSHAADRIVVTVPLDAREGLLGVWNGLSASNGVWVLPIYRAHITGADKNLAVAGDTITLTGEHFGDPSAASALKLGSTELATSEWTDTKIVATVPDGAASGYLGVWKRGIASNGRWLTITTP